MGDGRALVRARLCAQYLAHLASGVVARNAAENVDVGHRGRTEAVGAHLTGSVQSGVPVAMPFPLSAGLAQPVVGQTRRAILNVDDASPLETKLKNGTLHGAVVGMGVDPQMRNLSGTEIKARASDTSDRTVGGNAVNCAVRLITAPRSILNYLIGRLISHDEGKGAHHTAVLLAHIAHAIRNVGAPCRRWDTSRPTAWGFPAHT